MANGVTDGGMDSRHIVVPLVIRMRDNINLINDMDVASIVGLMDVSMKENFTSISDMGKEPLRGRVVTHIKVTFIMDNEKDMVALRLRVEVIIPVGGKMDDTTDLEVRCRLHRRRESVGRQPSPCGAGDSSGTLNSHCCFSPIRSSSRVVPYRL